MPCDQHDTEHSGSRKGNVEVRVADSASRSRSVAKSRPVTLNTWGSLQDVLYSHNTPLAWNAHTLTRCAGQKLEKLPPLGSRGPMT